MSHNSPECDDKGTVRNRHVLHVVTIREATVHQVFVTQVGNDRTALLLGLKICHLGKSEVISWLAS